LTLVSGSDFPPSGHSNSILEIQPQQQALLEGSGLEGVRPEGSGLILAVRSPAKRPDPMNLGLTPHRPDPILPDPKQTVR